MTPYDKMQAAMALLQDQRDSKDRSRDQGTMLEVREMLLAVLRDTDAGIVKRPTAALGDSQLDDAEHALKHGTQQELRANLQAALGEAKRLRALETTFLYAQRRLKAVNEYASMCATVPGNFNPNVLAMYANTDVRDDD